jgi:hypothetical protein
VPGEESVRAQHLMNTSPVRGESRPAKPNRVLVCAHCNPEKKLKHRADEQLPASGLKSRDFSFNQLNERSQDTALKHRMSKLELRIGYQQNKTRITKRGYPVNKNAPAIRDSWRRLAASRMTRLKAASMNVSELWRADALWSISGRTTAAAPSVMVML